MEDFNKKSRGITERELDDNLLARIGMGNYFQRQTLSVTIDESSKRVIPIPMENYNSDIYKFEVRTGSIPFSDYRYEIDTENNTIILNDDEEDMVVGSKVDFIFQWNAYINKNIEMPTVYLSDCNAKICQINHNMMKYPHIDVLEVMYGAGIGAAGLYPAGTPSKMIYPRIDYIDRKSCILYLNEEYNEYKNPKLNRIEEGKYIVTFDDPCVKSLLILVDKYELFTSDEDFSSNKRLTEITNPVKGFVNNQTIYGQTLKNLWNIEKIAATWDTVNTVALLENKTQISFNSGTHTVVNTSDKDITIAKYNITESTYGYEYIIKANSALVIELESGYSFGKIIGKDINGWNSNNYSDLNTSIVIIEGDYSENYPTKYFSGLQSVGDDILTIKAINNEDENNDEYSEVINEYDVILRSVGNIADEFNIDSRTLTRRVGVMVIDNNTPIASITSISDTFILVSIQNLIYNTGSPSNISSICDRLNIIKYESYNGVQSPSLYNVYGSSYSEIGLCLKKSDLASVDTTGVQSYLKTNPIKLFYTLNEPVIEKISDLPIKLDDDSKFIKVTSNIVPGIDFTYPLNIKTAFNNLTDEISKLNKTIKERPVASNPNLLINSNFKNPVNQREKTSYNSHGYCIDRWYINSQNTACVSIVNGGIKLDNTMLTSSDVDKALALNQYIENGKDLINKILTLSISVGGKVFSLTGKVNSNNTITRLFAEFGQIALVYTEKYGVFVHIGLLATKFTSIIIEWVKLEYGDKVTKFIPNNITEELLKCQRYYYHFHNFMSICVSTPNTTIRRSTIIFPVQMRIIPTTNIKYQDSSADILNITVNSVHIGCNSETQCTVYDAAFDSEIY